MRATVPTVPTVVAAANPGRIVQDRDADVTAVIRCRAYGLYSVLLASPHEIDPEKQLQESDGSVVAQPYNIDLNEIIASYLQCPEALRRREYSGLFEVGDRGPPVPIREQLQFSNLAGVREDLLRFYEFFDYGLDQNYAWVPDHLSVMLEFYHLLCYHECSCGDEQLSYQLAQLDFASRHLLHWLPLFADRINAVSSQSIYARIAMSLSEFIARDYEWQASTIVATNLEDDS